MDQLIVKIKYRFNGNVLLNHIINISNIRTSIN